MLWSDAPFNVFQCVNCSRHVPITRDCAARSVAAARRRISRAAATSASVVSPITKVTPDNGRTFAQLEEHDEFYFHEVQWSISHRQKLLKFSPARNLIPVSKIILKRILVIFLPIHFSSLYSKESQKIPQSRISQSKENN